MYTIDYMKEYLKTYCDDCGKCENCLLMDKESPLKSNCYTHATNEELINNFNYVLERC